MSDRISSEFRNLAAGPAGFELASSPAAPYSAFNLDYEKKKVTTAAECEAALRSSKQLMDALELFLGSDPLTKVVAKMTTLYNSFADFARLKRG
jgi:hypothetical protein